MIQIKSLVVHALLVIVVSSVAYGQPTDTSLLDLDQKISFWMKDWKVPGMAVGVVKRGEVLLHKGYGVRNVETGQPVTPKTVFRIASISKAFTSLSAALLVDAGKLEWDKPVAELVPEFKTEDPCISREITIRDMLCHRTGLPEHFLLYDIYPQDRKFLVNSLQYTQTSLGFRQHYHYNNVVYAVAGYVIGYIAGMTWEVFVQTNIFDPLDMDQSNFDMSIQQSKEFAYPHYYKNGQFHIHEFQATPSSNPAGGINSSLDDMLKWLDMYLNYGKVAKMQFISQDNLAETCTPHIPTKFIPWSSTSPMEAYGLGWNIEVYRGHTFINHGGLLKDRYCNWIAWLPREEIGIVILSNAESLLPYYLCYIITDRLTGIDISFWDSILAEEAQKQGKSSEGEPARSSLMPPSLSESLQGIYFNPAYGSVEVRVSDTISTIQFGEHLQIPLFYITDSTLMVLYQKEHYSFEIHLKRDREGRVISLSGAFCPWQDVEFRRVSD